MRLLKNHKGQTVHIYLDGLNLQGVLVDVAADSVSLRDAVATEPNGAVTLPGPAVVSTAAILWAAVVP